MTDIQSKYQKLASEFAKLRAQVPVLKKAVLDEQEKEEALKEALKEKDTAIRKYEQELDSLTFRNKQLSSRVEVLQQELGESSPTKSKGKIKKPNSGLPISSPTGPPEVMGEELQNKIEENARLHKKVHEADAEHRRAMIALQERLNTLESEASQHQAILSKTRNSSKMHLDKLQQEKAVLEIKLQKQEFEAAEARSRADIAEEELQAVQKELGCRLEEAHRTIQSKLQFDDMKHSDLHALNVPAHDRYHQLRAKELVNQGSTIVKEFVQGMSNLHTYFEQRIHIYPVNGDQEPLSDINKKLCQHLHENSSYLRPVEQAYRSFQETLNEETITKLETTTGLKDIAENFHRYSAYANRLLPYTLLSIEEECAVSSCTQTLEEKNMEVHAALRHFTSSLTKIDSYISLLSAQSDPNQNDPCTSRAQLFCLLASAATDFHCAVKDLSKHYNAKVSLEHQLPTATQKLQMTDECIISSLISLVTCTNKLCTFLSTNMEDLCDQANCHLSDGHHVAFVRHHPAVAMFKQKSADYISSLSTQCSESVPYRIAVHNRRTLLSSTESRESLAQQVLTFQEKLAKLEQEREHWMLEAQLLQMKYEKEFQNKRLKDMQRAADEMVPTTASVTTCMMGSVEMVLTHGVEGDPREQLIKKHFSGRITELNTQLQVADSKALNFHAECRALHKRLGLVEVHRDQLDKDLTDANQSVAQLKDELQTTTRSYESQLCMMSEHLAGMNEKLATQKDEVEALKYQLQQNTKGTKKGRLK